MLKKLHLSEPSTILHHDEMKCSHHNEKLIHIPTGKQIIKFFFKNTFRYLMFKKTNYKKVEQWCLLFYLFNNKSKMQRKFQRIIPPKDRFYADPFVVKKGKRYFVFIEEFPYKEKKGYISYFEIDEHGNYTPTKKILERPYHLSYPFIFEFENNWYMIPESSENKTIDLYKCISFPDKWEYVRTLLNNIIGLDNTILEKNGKWWLFTSTPETNESPNDTVSIFYSEDLLRGEWIPHPKNPIISDVRRARSAGRIFYTNGNLIRPSQDCSGGYGRGIKLNLIKKLDENNYEEIPYGSIYSHEKKIYGIHTYSKDGDLTVFDYKILRHSE